MKRWSIRLLAAIGIMLLAGCVTSPTRHLPANTQMLVAQELREQALAQHTRWTLEGRLGVSDGRDSGSGSLQWHQDGAVFRFTVHAPVTGKTWVLSGDTQGAELEGLRDAAVRGGNPAELLLREVGWQVPFTQLVDWVRAARAPGTAQVQFDAQGLPAQIEQDGWTIRYGDYDPAQSPPLPRRVFASKGEQRVRLAIRRWQS